MTQIVKIFADMPRLVGGKIIIYHIHQCHQRSINLL